MAESKNVLAKTPCADVDIRSRILTIRGVQVMLDWELARLYGVETRVLNQAVKRNMERFPQRFRFQLTKTEMSELITDCDKSEKKKHYPGTAAVFTEQGVAMLATVLKSPVAVGVSIRIMDAFVAMRRTLATLAPLLARVEANERRQILDQAKNDANQLHNEERVKLILDAMQDKSFPPQKIFFENAPKSEARRVGRRRRRLAARKGPRQFYDAFAQMKKFIRSAKKELIIIDPYFDDSVLPIIAQKRVGVRVTVVNCPRGAKLLHAVDVKQFNLKCANSLVIKTTDKFHDRFLIIDNASVIHIGASLNCLGKKCFACSTFDSSNIPEMLAKLPK